MVAITEGDLPGHPQIPTARACAWRSRGDDPGDRKTQIRLGAGEPKSDDRMVPHEGQDLPRIAHPISEALNSSTIDLVETLKAPAPSIKTPEDEFPLTDGS